jgi:hypothetical protein
MVFDVIGDTRAGFQLIATWFTVTAPEITATSKTSVYSRNSEIDETFISPRGANPPESLEKNG